ncbi:beta-lactamase-like protein [Mycena sanguinolenta]|nr:beta-lactamase-like protein [Mycena sanguinolenta]
MSESPPSLPAPSANQPYMHISALQAGRAPRRCPSLSFYLKHSSDSERDFIFDLGIRRDWESFPPATRERFGALTPWEVPQSVESCVKGGITPAEVEKVVISHVHFDHIGDHPPFTKATFVLGRRSKTWLDDGYPGNPNSIILSESTLMDRTVFLNLDNFKTSIGPFPHALDFFGDGSVYILDTPGHCHGQINVLARTSSDGAWMYFGGDIAHDTRLLTDPTTHIGHHAESGSPCCLHTDPAQAAIDIGRVRQLVKMPRVEFVIAHDWEWYERNFERQRKPSHAVAQPPLVPERKPLEIHREAGWKLETRGMR